jgi:hypothetical protein
MREQIKQAAFQRYKLDIFTKSRKRPLVMYRHAVMTALRIESKLTLYQIGRMFNSDHATVVHAIKTVNNTSYLYEVGIELEFWKQKIRLIIARIEAEQQQDRADVSRIIEKIERLERELQEIRAVV